MGLSSYVLLIAVAAAVAIKLHTRRPFPRVGNQTPFGIGYLITALQAITKGPELIEEGLKKYPGKPFVLPTLGGSLLLTANKGDIEIMRRSDDSVWNQPIAVNENLQLDYVMNEFQQRTPYQAAIIRSDVTKAISKFIPGVVEETQLSTEETFSPNGRTVMQIKVFDTMTPLVARIGNRAMLGLPLCRDPGYTHAIVHFAELLIPYSKLLLLVPRITRGVVYWMVSSVAGGKQEPLKFLVPYLKDRLHDRQAHTKTPDINSEQSVTVADLLMDAAPPAELDDLRLLAMRVMNANFAAIHTSSIITSHALFEIACMPQSDIQRIREEITTALEEEGGWNKPALARLWLLDSLLREVARVYGLGLKHLDRLAIKEGVLSDGTVVPSGWTISPINSATHQDPSIYPNPDTFDPFRFAKLRMEAESDVKYGFATLDNDYLLFGVGRHACPGRFFASMELKIILAIILLNWDVSLPEGVKERPKNMVFQMIIMPPLKAELVFTKRSG